MIINGTAKDYLWKHSYQRPGPFGNQHKLFAYQRGKKGAREKTSRQYR